VSNSKQTKQKQKPQQKKKKKKKDANLDKRHTGHGVVKEAGRHAQTVHGMVNDWVFKFNFLEEEGVDAGGHSRARLFPVITKGLHWMSGSIVALKNLRYLWGGQQISL